MSEATTSAFAGVRTLANGRFNEVLLFLAHISELEPEKGKSASTELRILKGLFFVHLYGAFESSMNELVTTALLQVKSTKPQNCDLIHEFNVISLSRSWKSIKDTGYKDAFEKMAQFFSKIHSEDYHDFDETLFSSELQNIWAKVIRHILLSFGIQTFSLTVSDGALIDEVVDKRNAIAHGRETPSTIGGKYQTDALKTKMQGIQQLVYALIDNFENYCTDRIFVRTEARSKYPNQPAVPAEN